MVSDFLEDEFNQLEQNQVEANSSKYPFLKSLNLGDDVERRLSLNLNSVVTGNDLVYLTPIGKSYTPEVVLDKFNKLFDSKSGTLNINLIKLEIANKSKYGPRSIQKPWVDRKASLLDYYSNNLGAHEFNFIPDMPKLNLRPTNLATSAKYIRAASNSGLPYYRKKGLCLDKTILNFDKQLSSNYPCVLFTRTQEGGKTRNVWGYPFANTLNENRFYVPLLSYQKDLCWRSALLGPDFVDKSITKLMINKAVDMKYLSVDFSSYDASISNSLIDCSFKYISNLFQRSYEDEILLIKDSFNSIGIITPTGILHGKHGVPSGATFTNEVDSIAQFMIAKLSGIQDQQLNIQGDDGAYCISDLQYKDFKANCIYYGLELNEDKSYYNDEFIVYLQRFYCKEYLKGGLIGGIYPLYRALNRIIHQERYDNFEDFGLSGVDYYSIRTISILENCKYHPLFYDFVCFIHSLDKYALKYTEQSVHKYIEYLNRPKGSVGLISNQIGDKVSGINNFETVKILKALTK